MERNCFGSRQRFAFYGYLAEVFEFHKLLRRNNKARIVANRIAKLCGIRKRKRTHPIRVIIDATSAAGVKTKDRWSRALRYAWRERNNRKSLIAFFGEVGGPAGAAAKWSALRSRDRNSQVGLDTQDRVAEIPLIVSVDLLEPGQLFAKGGRVFRQPDATEAELQGNPETGSPGNS